MNTFKIVRLLLCFILFSSYRNSQSIFFTLKTQCNLNDSLPLLLYSNDYLAPALTIYDEAFNLQNNRWIVPAGDEDITEVGAWIIPKSAGFTIIASLLFGLNSKALNINYENSLKSLIEISHRDLAKNTGRLFKYTYNSNNDLGSVDPKSVRYETMGVGATPEQSLAEAQIAEISNLYLGNNVYPNLNKHYVWIYKDSSGNLKIGTIKPPFTNALEVKAFALKIEMLKDTIPNFNYNDNDLVQYDLYIKWEQHVNTYKEQLAEKNTLNTVTQLQDDFKKKQDEYNDLYKQYLQAKKESENVNSGLQFLNLCQTLTEAFNNNHSNLQASDKSEYDFENSYLQSQLKDDKPKLNRLGIELNNYDFNLKKIFKSNGLPPPTPQNPIPQL